MKKIMKMMMLLGLVFLLPVGKVDAASKAEVEFINVCTNANTEGKYKGDCTLFKYKDKYYLVDTGSGHNYDSASDPLRKRINKLISDGKKLSGIVITHHSYKNI